MGTSMKNNKSKAVSEEITKVEVSTPVEEKVAAEPKKERKYSDSEGIICRSITPGRLFMTGIKSRIVYMWANHGDEVEVEYQDLIAAIRSNNSYIMQPFFIIEDEELVKKFPQVSKLYETLYSIGDLTNVLTELSPKNMEATILSLPAGAQDSIKHIASKMISNGTLDSVQKIKILDKIFDTELMLMTGLFGD